MLRVLQYMLGVSVMRMIQAQLDPTIPTLQGAAACMSRQGMCFLFGCFAETLPGTQEKPRDMGAPTAALRPDVNKDDHQPHLHQTQHDIMPCQAFCVQTLYLSQPANMGAGHKDGCASHSSKASSLIAHRCKSTNTPDAGKPDGGMPIAHANVWVLQIFSRRLLRSGELR